MSLYIAFELIITNISMMILTSYNTIIGDTA